MPANPESTARLKKVVEKTPKIAKVHKEVKAAFGPNETKLRAAIAAKKRNLIETYKAVNQAQIDKIGDVIGDINWALVSLSELNQDSDFVAPRVAQVEKLAEIIDSAQADLTEIFQKAKRLDNDAEKGVTDAIAGSKLELRELALLHDSVKDHTAEAKAAFTKLEAIAVRADAAVKARDAKALATAQADGKKVELAGIEFQQKAYADQAKALQEKAAKLGDAALAADLTDGAKDVLANLKGSGVYVEYGLKQAEHIAGMTVEQIDMAKALKATGLDKKFEPKLKKALEGPPAARVKALDAIAKEAKSEKDGKAMLAELVKQKVVDA